MYARVLSIFKCSKFLSCVGFPACKAAVWFPETVLEVSRDESICSTCQPRPVHMWVPCSKTDKPAKSLFRRLWQTRNAGACWQRTVSHRDMHEAAMSSEQLTSYHFVELFGNVPLSVLHQCREGVWTSNVVFFFRGFLTLQGVWNSGGSGWEPEILFLVYCAWACLKVKVFRAVKNSYVQVI